MVNTFFRTVLERDNAVTSFLDTSTKSDKEELASQIEMEFFNTLAKIDEEQRPIYEYFKPDEMSFFNIELFSDILFYGYGKVLRYRPRYGYGSITLTARVDMYDLLYNKKLLYRSITSFTPLHTRKLPTGLTVTASVTFAGAHFLPEHEALCRYLHGHEWKVEVMYGASKPDHKGMVVDFGIIKEVLNKQIVTRLDYSMLNDVITIPTAEHIAVYIYNHIYDEIDGLITVAVHETPTNRATAR